MRSFGLLAVPLLFALAATRANAAPTPWWLRTDLGPPSPASAFARMWTETIDDAVGSGGLRLSSAGQGGGPSPAAVAMTEPVRTVGNGAGVDNLTAFDGRDRLTQHLTAKVADGLDRRLPADVIQRVVRDNFGQFQACYDTGRRASPGLRGRVLVKFVIEGSGRVAFAADAGSDLPDDGVLGCIVRAYDTLVFPPSTERVVTVVYGLVLTPDRSLEEPP